MDLARIILFDLTHSRSNSVNNRLLGGK